MTKEKNIEFVRYIKLSKYGSIQKLAVENEYDIDKILHCKEYDILFYMAHELRILNMKQKFILAFSAAKLIQTRYISHSVYADTCYLPVSSLDFFHNFIDRLGNKPFPKATKKTAEAGILIPHPDSAFQAMASVMHALTDGDEITLEGRDKLEELFSPIRLKIFNKFLKP